MDCSNEAWAASVGRYPAVPATPGVHGPTSARGVGAQTSGRDWGVVRAKDEAWAAGAGACGAGWVALYHVPTPVAAHAPARRTARGT